jgi:hypothetical protein
MGFFSFELIIPLRINGTKSDKGNCLKELDFLRRAYGTNEKNT